MRNKEFDKEKFLTSVKKKLTKEEIKTLEKLLKISKSKRTKRVSAEKSIQKTFAEWQKEHPVDEGGIFNWEDIQGTDPINWVRRPKTIY